MPQGAQPRPEGQSRRVREAVRLLEDASIVPLTRPRVLAAARALGMQVALREWYEAAWELERDGSYLRRGNGDSEWLEAASASTATGGQTAPGDPFVERAWLAGALRQELERIHDAAALAALGRTLATGHAAEAERCLRAAAELDTRDTESALALARGLAERGDLEAASAEVERIVRQLPDNADAHVLLANFLDDRRQRSAARRHFRRALELAPGSAIAHYNYGVLLVREGDREEAERHLREACKLAPDEAGMLVTLAIVVGDNDELDEAEKLLRRALALDPDSVRARRQYGVLLARRRRYTQAEDELRHALSLHPDDGVTLMHLCAVLDELGRHVEAETLFRQACTNDPSQAEAYFKWMLRHDETHAPTLVNL
ncbi:MAG TPA: tetratricopeptide repeat protein, partial [Ktedonobacterales bacterium]|nr:tetratricopeptide repeat protein [Ktedonobacterales bacterium]